MKVIVLIAIIIVSSVYAVDTSALNRLSCGLSGGGTFVQKTVFVKGNGKRKKVYLRVPNPTDLTAYARRNAAKYGLQNYMMKGK